MRFQEAIAKHFKFTGRSERDNLPALALPRYNWGPSGQHGRHSLARMLGDMSCRRGVEIGTHYGDSALLWLHHSPNLHLTCVDPYVVYNARLSQEERNKAYEEAKEKLKPYNAEIIRAKSLDVVDDFEDRSLDFVHIDGNHLFDAVMRDLICWAPKVRGSGVVLLHDYHVFWQGGVMLAVNAYTQAHRVEPWYVATDKAPTAFWERGMAKAR